MVLSDFYLKGWGANLSRQLTFLLHITKPLFFSALVIESQFHFAALARSKNNKLYKRSFSCWHISANGLSLQQNSNEKVCILLLPLFFITPSLSFDMAKTFVSHFNFVLLGSNP